MLLFWSINECFCWIKKFITLKRPQAATIYSLWNATDNEALGLICLKTNVHNYIKKGSLYIMKWVKLEVVLASTDIYLHIHLNVIASSKQKMVLPCKKDYRQREVMLLSSFTPQAVRSLNVCSKRWWDYTNTKATSSGHRICQVCYGCYEPRHFFHHKDRDLFLIENLWLQHIIP